MNIYFYFSVWLDIGWWKQSLVHSKSVFLQLSQDLWTKPCVGLTRGRPVQETISTACVWTISGILSLQVFALALESYWIYTQLSLPTLSEEHVVLLYTIHVCSMDHFASLEEGGFSCFQASWMKDTLLITPTLVFVFTLLHLIIPSPFE